MGFGVKGGYPRSAGDIACAAEPPGFAGLWSSETKHDAFLPLAVAAKATQRIELGTSVAIAFSRSPMEVAQSAWSHRTRMLGNDRITKCLKSRHPRDN